MTKILNNACRTHYRLLRSFLKPLAFSVVAAASTASFAAEAPFEVSAYVERGVPVIQLAAVADQAVLTGFTVNRGNCKAMLGGIRPLPLNFKFGDGVKLFARTCNSVKEVALTTDSGTFTYSFSR